MKKSVKVDAAVIKRVVTLCLEGLDKPGEIELRQDGRWDIDYRDALADAPPTEFGYQSLTESYREVMRAAESGLPCFPSTLIHVSLLLRAIGEEVE